MARQLANAVFLPGDPLAPCLAVFYERSGGEEKIFLFLLSAGGLGKSPASLAYPLM